MSWGQKETSSTPVLAILPGLGKHAGPQTHAHTLHHLQGFSSWEAWEVKPPPYLLPTFSLGAKIFLGVLSTLTTAIKRLVTMGIIVVC